MAHSNWNCPKCGNPNISGETFVCPKCGKKRNRWGYWDCRYCGTKGIRGDHHECAQCGHARDRNVKFYLRDDLVEFVDEVSGESAVRIGHQNWICPYCSQQNDDNAQTCVYCGAVRAESEENYKDVKPPEPSVNPAKPQEKLNFFQKFWKQNACCCIFLLIMAVLFLIGLIVNIASSISSKKVRTADLAQATWESRIYVQELKTFEGSDWTLPDDARLLRTQIEDYTYIDHYERRSREVWVDDPVDNDWDWNDGGGWDDYGNGQFGVFGLRNTALLIQTPPVISLHYETEYYDEPIYATEPREKYYYEYDEWVDTRTVTGSGSSAETPEYSELLLGEKERESYREIVYFVEFDYKNKTETVECSETEWQRMIADGNVTFRVEDPYSSPKIILVDPNETAE